MASNDYLGLGRHPRVRRAAADAALTWGAGAGASRLVTGTTELHTALERELAEFTGREAALVLSTNRSRSRRFCSSPYAGCERSASMLVSSSASRCSSSATVRCASAACSCSVANLRCSSASSPRSALSRSSALRILPARSCSEPSA
ncbi:aminotransferase class I/II-fold pyridoxal phosphate-dependent enzyme [Klebsiella pneumoniae]|nr:aminotransferase class I/II-fold pyridoxal phosphate-dependent enzyme [Klebsiella pneumoniae]